MSKTPCGLYVISPDTIEISAFALRLKRVLSCGDIASFQLRLKMASDDDICRATEQLMPLCHQYQVPFILNDRLDLAQQLGVDGVHLGGDDGDVKQARQLLGEEKIIGKSCYNSIDAAIDAGQSGASYVSFGAFFPTSTKEVEHYAQVSLLDWWHKNVVVPCVAIGGIDATNCTQLVQNGADFIAVISAIWDHPDGETMATQQLLESITHASR